MTLDRQPMGDKSFIPDLQLWGKVSGNYTRHYPLLAHLLDSAAAAQVIFDTWLPQRFINQLNMRLADSGYTSRQVVVTSAGEHDLGKITPVFQGQILSKSAGNFTGQIDYLEEAGYWIPKSGDLPKNAMDERLFVARHEVASTLFLQDQLGIDPSAFACIVGGHHGKWHIFGESEYDMDRFRNPMACKFYENLFEDGSQWHKQAEIHRCEISKVLGNEYCKDDDLMFNRATVPLLTSIVCLSDWIASSEESLDNGHQNLDVLIDHDSKEFFTRRRKFFEEYISGILGVPKKPIGSFYEVFGFDSLRPVQNAMVLSQKLPGLSIVMVPMGEGKTEAALGHWMSSAEDKQGIYFALPTMATADAMFERIKKFFSHSEGHVLASLAHGRAILNAFYQPSHESNIISTDTDDQYDQQNGLAPQDWFTGRHRALLAPITVATVDQLLSGILRHKYNFMRLLGAMTKTVVLDEVHTYDPYMSELLCRFLEWAGWLNTDVVLLSATIPTRRLNEYIGAYCLGQGKGKLPPIEYLSYPSVLRVVDGEIETIDLNEGTSGREINLEIAWSPTCNGKKVSFQVADEAIALIKKYPKAKIGIIMNTISGAQEVAKALVDVSEVPIGLLHSRMPAFERRSRVEKAIRDFGKESADGANVLVATQIVEASIDLDFDILITQICPVASLVQRCGRVWRHDLHSQDRQRSRPSELSVPLVVVVYPEPFPDSSYELLPYMAAEIKKTQDAFNRMLKKNILIPDDVQNLVDAGDISLRDIETMGNMAENSIIKDKVARLHAQEVRIPRPQEVTKSLNSLLSFTEGDLGDEQCATRMIDNPTATVLLVADKVKPRSRYEWSKPLSKKPTRDEALDILDFTIPISGYVLNYADENSSFFTTNFFEHRLLKDVILVYLDKTDKLVVDEFLGICRKSEI